jgi:hypothetical protein
VTDQLPLAAPGVDRPTEGWPLGDVTDGADVEPLLDATMGDVDRYGTTYAVAVVHRGRLLADERRSPAARMRPLRPASAPQPRHHDTDPSASPPRRGHRARP